MHFYISFYFYLFYTEAAKQNRYFKVVNEKSAYIDLFK